MPQLGGLLPIASRFGQIDRHPLAASVVSAQLTERLGMLLLRRLF